jgi:nucleotide-binding universal stress UspA family protein
MFSPFMATAPDAPGSAKAAATSQAPRGARPAIDNLDRPPKTRLDEDRRLLGELGGTLREVRAGQPASRLIRAARKAGACQLVIGSRRRSRRSPSTC